MIYIRSVHKESCPGLAGTAFTSGIHPEGTIWLPVF
jgi:hypothetical protein